MSLAYLRKKVHALAESIVTEPLNHEYYAVRYEESKFSSGKPDVKYSCYIHGFTYYEGKTAKEAYKKLEAAVRDKQAYRAAAAKIYSSGG